MVPLSRDFHVALLTALLALGLGALSLVGPGLSDPRHLLFFVFTPTLAGLVGTAVHPVLRQRLGRTLSLGPRPAHTVLLLAAGPLAVALTAGVDMVPRLLLGGPLGEELGWRAVLLPLLWRRLGAWRAALAVGLVWGPWHLPLHLSSFEQGTYDDGLIGVLVQCLICVGLSFPFLLVWARSGGCLWACIGLHAAVNAATDSGESALISAVFVVGWAALERWRGPPWDPNAPELPEDLRVAQASG